MIQLNRRMQELVANTLQADTESPNYIVRVKKVEDSDKDPYEFRGDTKGAISIEVQDSSDNGAATVTVQMQDTYGLTSPEVLNEQDWKLVIKPGCISVTPGTRVQFCAYMVSPYETII